MDAAEFFENLDDMFLGLAIQNCIVYVFTLKYKKKYH